MSELLGNQNVVSQARADLQQLIEQLNSVVVGKPEPIRMALVALLAEGHVLIEDVPGVGKTLLARAIAASIDCPFRRIQFTPDLLPSDILGSSVYSSATGEFLFKPGPIFSNVILADEINRTTPRTQSALLEAMSDGQVSVEGTTHVLAKPFLVLATQNPFEFEGTYVLPESQLDRFMLRLKMGYPGAGRGAADIDHAPRRGSGGAVEAGDFSGCDSQYPETGSRSAGGRECGRLSAGDCAGDARMRRPAGGCEHTWGTDDLSGSTGAGVPDGSRFCGARRH